MLRLLVLLLLLANGAYFAWTQGLLAAWGLAPVQQAEPQRVTQQIRPQALRLLTAEEARRLEAQASAPRPPECLQAGPLADAEAEAVRAVVAAWPAGTWSLDAAVEPARWIVYMGKYPSREALDKKKAELRGLGVSFEAPGNASLEPGLSLGGFASQAAANQELATLTRRGVRTARVVQERPELRGALLRLPALDDGLRARLDEVRGALKGRPLAVCR